ncbi:hypothetical protein V2W45_1225675, partial [Cenococcum geophilum]
RNVLGPASTEAIAALLKEKIISEMLRLEGKAKIYSICQYEFKEGEEATMLHCCH